MTLISLQRECKLWVSDLGEISLPKPSTNTVPIEPSEERRWTTHSSEHTTSADSGLRTSFNHRRSKRPCVGGSSHAHGVVGYVLWRWREAHVDMYNGHRTKHGCNLDRRGLRTTRCLSQGHVPEFQVVYRLQSCPMRNTSKDIGRAVSQLFAPFFLKKKKWTSARQDM